MKRFLMILLASVLLLSTAGAEQFLLPTPPPSVSTPTPAPEPVLPAGAEDQQPVGELPDPSYLLHTTGEIYENYFMMGETAMDARIYPVFRVGNAISEYMNACTEAGYKWELSDIFTGYIAYRLFGGGYNAYFIPDFNGKVLLLAEQGMPIQDMMPAPDDFEQNKLLVHVNDSVFQLDYQKGFVIRPSSDLLSVRTGNSSSFEFDGTNLVFYAANAPYQLVGVSFPRSVRTAETYTLNRKNQNDAGFVLCPDIGGVPDELYLCQTKTSNVTVLAGKNGWDRFRIGLTSDSDYLNVQLIYVSGDEYRGRFEGVLCDGSLTVSGTFWVVN